MATAPATKNKKTLPKSFVKKVSIFFGSFLGLLVLAVIVTQLALFPSAPVVQQRYVVPKVADKPRIDIEDALQDSERRRKAEEMGRANTAILSRIEQQQIQLAQALNANTSVTQSVESRVALLEAGQSGRASRAPRTTVAEELAKRARITDPKLARTFAVVAGRAWVNQDGVENDVTVGETLSSTQMRVHAIDAESSVVLTKPTKH